MSSVLIFGGSVFEYSFIFIVQNLPHLHNVKVMKMFIVPQQWLEVLKLTDLPS